MDSPRRVWVKVEYDGMDITDAITDGLLSFTYTDANDEANEIKITVEDRDGNWAGPWYPKVGTKEVG
jgi:phage protein D